LTHFHKKNNFLIFFVAFPSSFESAKKNVKQEEKRGKINTATCRLPKSGLKEAQNAASKQVDFSLML
jgi:hypothetical protein